MNGTASDAGQYRRHAVRIAGAGVPLANWLRVPDRIVELTERMVDSGEDVVARLARTHAEFESLFDDALGMPEGCTDRGRLDGDARGPSGVPCIAWTTGTKCASSSSRGERW